MTGGHRSVRRQDRRRMGSSKALLPFGAETMLQRVVRLLGTVVSPIVVVAAPEQSLPELPASVIVTRDEREGRGPLEGLRAGLKALPRIVEQRVRDELRCAAARAGFVEAHDRAARRARHRRHGDRRLCASAVGRLPAHVRCRTSKRCWRRIGCVRCSCSTLCEPAACSRRRWPPSIPNC